MSVRLKRFAVTTARILEEEKGEREGEQAGRSLDKRLCQIDGSVNAASDCLAEDRLALDNHHALQSGWVRVFLREILKTKREKRERKRCRVVNEYRSNDLKWKQFVLFADNRSVFKDRDPWFRKYRIEFQIFFTLSLFSLQKKLHVGTAIRQTECNEYLATRKNKLSDKLLQGIN